jgi:hypothetical protein
MDRGAGASSRSGSRPGMLRSMPISSCSSSTARMRVSTGMVGMCSPLSSLEGIHPALEVGYPLLGQVDVGLGDRFGVLLQRVQQHHQVL